jgi:hypothetical protein
MEKVFALVVSFMISVSLGKAQTIPMGAQTGAGYVTPVPYGFMNQLPPAPAKTIGDYYLDESWLKGNILLSSNSRIENVQFRYNLRENNFEIKTEKDVKLLPGVRVLSFEWVDNQSPRDGFYFSAAPYDYNNTHLLTFLKEVVSGDDYSLAIGVECKLIPANYNVALNVGNRDNQIVKDQGYYLFHDNKLLKVDSSRKKFSSELKTFSGHDLAAYMKENKVDPKQIDDLLILTEKLNTL